MTLAMNSRAWERAAAPAPAHEVRLHVLRNATFEALRDLAAERAEVRALKLRTTFSGYDPLLEVLGAAPDLRNTSATLILLTLDGLQGAWDGDRLDAAAALDIVTKLAQSALAEGTRSVLVSTFLPPIDAGPAFIDHAGLYRLNADIAAFAAADPRVGLVDVARFAAQLGEDASLDPRFWAHFKAPFAQPLLDRIGEAVASHLAQQAGQLRKVVVVDCDNTLWGGIVGEDGIGQLSFSAHDAKGRPFHAFQRQLASLRRRGVLLAIASKNEPADVHAVLDHPEMVLRRSDFAAERIGWGDKAESLVALSRELGIGLDAFVFVDDSAVECARVSQALPMVLVVQVPARTHQLPRVFARTPGFSGRNATEEDLRRADDYVAERKRAAEREHWQDRDAFLRSLAIVLSVGEAKEPDVARLAQLCQKTNQFNLTTTRLEAAEIRRMMDSERHLVVHVGARDRFGEQGIVGLATVAEGEDGALTIGAFMLSCRALGRSIEHALLAETVRLCRGRWGAREIRGRYIPTNKNLQTRDFYGSAGFLLESESTTGRSFVLPTSAEIQQPFVHRIESRWS